MLQDAADLAMVFNPCGAASGDDSSAAEESSSSVASRAKAEGGTGAGKKGKKGAGGVQGVVAASLTSRGAGETRDRAAWPAAWRQCRRPRWRREGKEKFAKKPLATFE